jgi:hypothetical protein
MAVLLPVSNTGRPDRVGDVVFIHGLDGDARATWTAPDMADGFWPGWLGAELYLVGIWSVSYEVRSSSWTGYSMALVDRARNVLDLLAGKEIGTRPVVFVVHSFGGLVVKQMLRAAADSPLPGWNAIAARTRGVVFLATPHAGSRLARLAGWIPFYRRTVTVQELEEHSPYLRDLGVWYRNRHATSGMRAAVFTETRNVRGVRVVHDGDPYLPGVEAVPLDDNHISITKPKSDKSQLYAGVREFIRACLQPATASGTAGPAGSPNPGPETAPKGGTAHVTGERNVAVGGGVRGGMIITGDGNVAGEGRTGKGP